MIEKRDSNIENVVLVGVITKEQDEEKSKELKRVIAVMKNKGELVRFNDINLDGKDIGKHGGLVV